MTASAHASVLVADGDRPRDDVRSEGSDAPRKIIDVAVGILLSPHGEFLMTSRPPGKVYAGYWEFPGGKIEAGESVEQALRRELQEEIGVTIGPATVWHTSLVDYPHALVRLHFCKVFTWQGELHMHEGQQFAWQRLPVAVAPVLPGSLPVLAWLGQPGQVSTPPSR
ncbi:MAG: NUDIX domain-containing protein [Burkholderiaceae bacterium]